MSELPKRLWQEVPNCQSGTQWYTKVGIGVGCADVMFDSGSALNSIPEEMLADIINVHKRKEIKLNDKVHPLLTLEK